MSIGRTLRLIATIALSCSYASSQTQLFAFDATVSSSSPTQVDYSVRVGRLQGRQIDPYLRGGGGIFELAAYYVVDLFGNDLTRLRSDQLIRVRLASGAGSFAIPSHAGITYCFLTLEAMPFYWGISGVHEAGVRVPAIPANSPTQVGVLGGAYTNVPDFLQVHNLVNSVVVPLPRSLGVDLLDQRKTLVLRDPVTGQTRFMQIQPWTYRLETDGGRRIPKEVVGYFHNKKLRATGAYYENLEVHAVPAADVQPPPFQLHSDLSRPITLSLVATPASGSGRYVFDCNLWAPNDVVVNGPLVKVLRYRGVLRPEGNISNPIPVRHCPIVNIIVEAYSGESFVNVKVMVSNSRFEGTGHFIFDEMRLYVPSAHIRSHNFRPEGESFAVYPLEASGIHSIALVRSLGGGRHNRLRQGGTFLWNMGIIAEFGPPGPRHERAAENLRVYLTQFFGNRALGANYFDQPFIRSAGIPDLRYRGMMRDWKMVWNEPTGINDNARRAFAHYVPRSRLHLTDGRSPYLLPYPCFGTRTGSESGVDEALMPRNGAMVLAYNANSIYMVEALETALFMGRAALTRQPIDTMFLGDGTANTLDRMRYLMWDATGSERIPEARMIGGNYFYNEANQTRSLFHPSLDYSRTSAYLAHVAEGNVPYDELLGPHDIEHSQRYVTHVMESMYKANPDFLAKIYMDAAAEMICSLSHYAGESASRSYTHLPYGTSLWALVNAPPGSGNGGRYFGAFAMQSEAMFHRPVRESDLIMGRQMAAAVQRIARPNGYMGCLYGPDSRHFGSIEENGLRNEVSQYLSSVLQRYVSPGEFTLSRVDLRWMADVWDMVFAGVAKAYLGSVLDAEARSVLAAIDLDLVGAYTNQFDGAYSTHHGTRIHIGLEQVTLGSRVFSVPGAIKNGRYANVANGPYEMWAMGVYNEMPALRAHMATTGRSSPEYRGDNRNLMLPVSAVGQESVAGAGIQVLWAFQQLGQ